MTKRWAVHLVAVSGLLAAVLFLGAPETAAQGLPEPGTCQDYCAPSLIPIEYGCQAGEWIYRVCMPMGPPIGLVVFAHGYIAPDEPLQVPDYQIDGVPLSTLVTSQGFVYATSSFPKNGLAIQEGIGDLVVLTSAIVPPDFMGPVLLAGASEGGAITALAMERHPEVFHGGLALCGPIGNFQKQINHYGDYRVLFDYFFPSVLPGTAVNPDPSGQVRARWESRYVPRIVSALRSNPAATAQLVTVLRIPVDPADVETSIGEAVVGNLWYNVFGTYDAQKTLGGQPFDNWWRYYSGSWNDFRLNKRVKRYRADWRARQNIKANYETLGQLDVPVVTMHTTGDAIVPYWHELFYRWKTFSSGSGNLHTNLPIFKYGHCTFNAIETQTAFELLLEKMMP